MILNNIYLKLTILSSAILMALTLVSCSDSIPMVNRINSKDELPTVSIENIKTTYTENGYIKIKLQAKLAEKFEGVVEPYIDFKKGISIVIYNAENKIETSAIADRATYYQNKKTWEASGNVVISNINGDVLKTNKLFGDDKEKKIFTNEKVLITKSDGSVINGKSGFESNTEFTIYQFINVDGRLFFHDEFNSEDTLETSSEQNVKTIPPKPNIIKEPIKGVQKKDIKVIPKELKPDKK